MGSDLRLLDRNWCHYILLSGRTTGRRKKLVSRYQFQVLVKTIGALLLPISLNIELGFFMFIFGLLHTIRQKLVQLLTFLSTKMLVQTPVWSPTFCS